MLPPLLKAYCLLILLLLVSPINTLGAGNCPLDETQLKMMERRKGIHYTDAQKKTYMELGGTPFLDMEYTVFGEVIDGLEVVDRIAASETDGSDRPTEDVSMKMIVIK